MQQPQLNPKWTRSCNPSEIAEVEKRLLANQDLFELLDKILVQMLEVNSRERMSKKSYEITAWSQYQADTNATERTIEKVRSLLKLQKEK